MWISHCMQSLDPLLLNAIVSHQVCLHNKAVCLCSQREMDLQKCLLCFDMNCELGRFHSFHFESNLQKKLGSLGSVGPLHLIDAAVLNHRFKTCLGSEWLQAICHFEATLQIFSEIGLPMLPVSSWHRLSTCRVGSTQVSSNSCELKNKTSPCKLLAHSWVSTWRGLHASDWEIKCLTDFQKPLCKWRIFEHAWSRLAALECGALWRA